MKPIEVLADALLRYLQTFGEPLRKRDEWVSSEILYQYQRPFGDESGTLSEWTSPSNSPDYNQIIESEGE